MPSTIIIAVGGNERLRASMTKNLKNVGIHVEEIWDKDHAPRKEPKCDFILVAIELCSSNLLEGVRVWAAKHNIPVVTGSYKWAALERRLKETGWLDQKPPATVDGLILDADESVLHSSGAPARWTLWSRTEEGHTAWVLKLRYKDVGYEYRLGTISEDLALKCFWGAINTTKYSESSFDNLMYIHELRAESTDELMYKRDLTLELLAPNWFSESETNNIKESEEVFDKVNAKATTRPTPPVQVPAKTLTVTPPSNWEKIHKLMAELAGLIAADSQIQEVIIRPTGQPSTVKRQIVTYSEDEIKL